MDQLYRLQKHDLTKASEVLVNAFMDDPLLNAFKDQPNFKEKYRAFYNVPLTYAFKYGEVYAPTKQLEGIMAWTTGDVADMTFWRMLRSGAMRPAFRMGSQSQKNIMPFVNQLSSDRAKNMKGQTFYYLALIGVAPEYQGKGYGKILLNSLIEKSERDHIPLYLETETTKNVAIYQHFGFNILTETPLPSLDMTAWTLLRKPS
ncbi:GNAT family N-acetyltransferase [Amphibacillus cookii]|uniref:GNAT family N-acetyltransferase n=1 Tax=Amphibacillus cookii TaxID=767787 RepID=UPI001958E1FD|nr:GNAT family N-acetyltransferase [Amphibacillus cookii]MBM7541310.1 ribosomal protein S18 acetylase RimI-like enzyme [Amphibacillus cookii]